MKTPELVYPEDLVVYVRRRNQWFYYASYKNHWIMDQVAWGKSFEKSGFPSDGDYSERFDIPILNEQTADTFLEAVRECRYTRDEMRSAYLAALDVSIEEAELYMPALWVDFDDKKLISYYPEPFSFEHFVPEGWEGLYQSFIENLPREIWYWKRELHQW